MGNSQSARRRRSRGHDAPVVIPQGQRAPYTPQQMQAMLMMGRFNGGDQEAVRGRGGRPWSEREQPHPGTGGSPPRPPHRAAFPASQGPPPPDVQQTYTLHNVVHLKKKTLELVPVDPSTGKFLLRFEVDLLAPCATTVFLDCEEYTDPSTQAVECAQGARRRPRGSPWTHTLSPPPAPPPPAPRSSATWKSAPLYLDQGMGQVVGGEDAPAHREHCLLDLSAVAGEHLSHTPGTYRFPLVIELREAPRPDGGGEAGPVPEQKPAGSSASVSARVQKTYATLDVSSPETPSATVIKQQIEVDGKMYEVQEIYGIEQNAAAAAGDDSVLCVVCLTNAVNTMCLPCRCGAGPAGALHLSSCTRTPPCIYTPPHLPTPLPFSHQTHVHV